MDRQGLQGVGLIMLVSMLVFVAFQYSETLQSWTTLPSDSSASSIAAGGAKVVPKLGVSGGIYQRTFAGAGKGRQLLQVATPAPAPAPSSSQSQTYISYGALTAGFVPCPPQSGRPYYTANCASASGPVQPYTRGCEAITNCARS